LCRHVLTDEKFRIRDKEDETITQLLFDSFCYTSLLDLKVAAEVPRIAVVDESTKATRTISELKLTVHAVFAIAVMKDIHRILGGDVAECYSATKALAEEAGRLVWHASKSNAAKDGGPLGPQWSDDVVKPVKAMESCARHIFGSSVIYAKNLSLQKVAPSTYDVPRPDLLPSWAFAFFVTSCEGLSELENEENDLHSEKWLRFRKSMSNMGLKYVSPAKDPLFVFRANPLLCGTLQLNLTLTTEEAGVALANSYLSLLYTVYLYHGIQQEEILPGIWPDLEKVMNVHIGSIFFGSRPTTPEDIYKRFRLRIGRPLPQLQRRTRPGSRKSSKSANDKGNSGVAKGLSPACLTVTETSKTFGRFFYGKKSLVRTIYSVNTVIQKSKKLHASKR